MVSRAIDTHQTWCAISRPVTQSALSCMYQSLLTTEVTSGIRSSPTMTATISRRTHTALLSLRRLLASVRIQPITVVVSFVVVTVLARLIRSQFRVVLAEPDSYRVDCLLFHGSIDGFDVRWLDQGPPHVTRQTVRVHLVEVVTAVRPWDAKPFVHRGSGLEQLRSGHCVSVGVPNAALDVSQSRSQALFQFCAHVPKQYAGSELLVPLRAGDGAHTQNGRFALELQ